MPMDLFTPSTADTATISASTSSSRVALAAAGATGGSSVRVHNASTVLIFIQFGDVTVTATTAKIPIPAGATETFEIGGAAYVAAIAASGSGNAIYFTSGKGA